MDEQPFPLPRATRETEILDSDGGAVYGPFGFKIFDTQDVRAYVRHAGEDWQTADVTAEKVAGLEFDDFTVTFAEALPATSNYLVQGSRLHDRQTAVTRGGAISGRALEKELSKQASVLEELWRDVTRGISSIPGMPGQTLVFGPDGKVRPGVDQSEIANAADYASAANEAREGAEAAKSSAEAAQAAAEAAAAGVNLPSIEAGDAGKQLIVKDTEDGYLLRAERDVVRAASRAALKALDGAKTPAALVYGEGGRAGEFVFQAGDYSTAVATDTTEGVYVAPGADPTGASGAWVRVNRLTGGPFFGSSAKFVNLADFGMSMYASAAANTAAFNAFMDFAHTTDGCKGVFPVGMLHVNMLRIDRNYVHLEGHMDGTWLVNNTPEQPAIYINKSDGQTTFGCSVRNLRIGQSNAVAVSGLNCGVRLENTYNTILQNIRCLPYPAPLRIGFIFINSGESNFSNLWASGSVSDGFRFSGGSPGGLCRGLTSHENGRHGFFFDGAGGHLVGLHGYNNTESAFYFNDNPSKPNRYFFGHSWIGDTSGSHNWYIKNLNCASFSDCWAATQNSATIASACGVYVDGAKVYDVEFHGLKAKNNNAHGFYAGAGAKNIKLVGGTFGSDPADTHGNGKVNPGSGIALGLVTDCTVSLARCLGNSQNGLILLAQASDYNTIVHNNFRDNTGAGFVNNSTGSNNVISNNIS